MSEPKLSHVAVWMRQEIRTDEGLYIDPKTDEFLYHRLAEQAAHEFNDEWLDDIEHWVWDLAIDMGDWWMDNKYK